MLSNEGRMEAHVSVKSGRNETSWLQSCFCFVSLLFLLTSKIVMLRHIVQDKRGRKIPCGSNNKYGTKTIKERKERRAHNAAVCEKKDYTQLFWNNITPILKNGMGRKHVCLTNRYLLALLTTHQTSVKMCVVQ